MNGRTEPKADSLADSLAALESRVTRALRTGDDRALQVLGYGEISTTLAFDTPDGPRAGKRLPLFRSSRQLEAYEKAFERYLQRLLRVGVSPVSSRLHALPLPSGEQVVYCVQPILALPRLGPALLRSATVTEGEEIFTQLFDLIAGAVTGQLGLDAQLSNWALEEDRWVYIDVTTPLMRDDQGRELLDTAIFAASLPWALQRPVERLLLGAILDKYYDLRGAVLDLLGNLIKERLTRWIPTFVALANKRLVPLGARPLTLTCVRRYYAADARMWHLLQALRRADRLWQRRVRNRPYPFLLPGRIPRHV